MKKTSSRRRICVVTGELAGPFYNGGIGTTNRAMALFLAQAGYDVDILYTHVSQGVPLCMRGTFEQHIVDLALKGVRLLCIPNASHWHDWPMRSFLAMEHLLATQYEVAFFDDMDGSAYYPLLARRTGCPELFRTLICVTAHSANQWIFDLNGKPIDTFELLQLNEMERRSIELADCLKSPSAYILGKYRSYGWKLPDATTVLPNLVSTEATRQSEPRLSPIKELVFFGRIEERKGLRLFCRALEWIKTDLKSASVTFLGKMTPKVGEFLLLRSATWPFEVRIINTYDQEQALAYLRKPGRLAIMASPEDNSPSTILECLEENIPFLAASGSGGEELIDPASAAQSLFAPKVESLAEKLQSALRDGAWTAAPALTQAERVRQWDAWLSTLDRLSQTPPPRQADAPYGFCLVLLLSRESSAIQIEQALAAIPDIARHEIDLSLVCTDKTATNLKAWSAPHFRSIAIVAADTFEAMMQSLGETPGRMVCLLSLSMALNPKWLERAALALNLNPALSAVTGLPGHVAATRDGKINAQPPTPGGMIVDRLLAGNLSALFPLSIDTNCGLIALRSEACRSISHLVPHDGRYDRMRDANEFIHHCLMEMQRQNLDFELIPDLPCGMAHQVDEFEVFRAEESMRALPERLYGYKPGSASARLAALAIDSGLQRERVQMHQRYLARMSKRVGYDVGQHFKALSKDSEDIALSRLALASGQIELATQLAARHGVQETQDRPFDISDYVRDAATNRIINLVEVMARGFDRQGNAELNVWGAWDRRKIVAKLNPETSGRTEVRLQNVDLSFVEHFTTFIQNEQTGCGPVRFRLELVSAGGMEFVAFERVLHGGDDSQWEIVKPECFLDDCTIKLGVEWADGVSSACGEATWLNPRFLGARAG